MAVQAKRKENEPLNSFLYRFNRSVHQSGVLKQSKSERFLIPKQNRNQRRKSAIYKAKMGAQIRQLKKAGILKGGEDIADIKKLLRNPKKIRIG